MLHIERVVVTGGRRYNDAKRIELDFAALVPLGLHRVAQGGHNVKRPRDLPPGRPWALLDGSAWALTVDIPRPGHSADALAWHAARAVVRQRELPGIKESVTYFADWSHGRGGGYRRNTEMLEAERPGLVLAYPDADSRGTWHACGAALSLGIPIAIWHPFCASADLLDPRRTNGHLVDGRGMARLAVGRSRTLYVPATDADAVRDWITLFASPGAD